ncbi:MAG TPA: hypothetical protein VFF78_02075 [Anaerolineaceae bacterium]|nr:hypothetical protein [Anaerolineaceae bacterium]
MLDDLRNSGSQFVEEEEQPQLEPQPKRLPPRRRKPFLGLTAQQRFALALMLFLSVCVLGALCLIATGRVILPF